MVNVHGLAASIRSTTESEIYDLNNQNADSIQRIISNAFTEPFTHLNNEMIRITFITGAGKQARQKYDPDAAKVVKATLMECGYKEDHGASCVMECGGSYKSQHDTGKNLRTIVVFPRIVDSAAAASAAGGGKEEVEPLIPEDSPGYKIAVCSMNVFRNMLNAKCPSWSQKKGCLDCLQALKGVVNDLDTKLMQGQPLGSAEQNFYDEVVELDTKINLVRHEMQEQVETGNVTKFELDMLLEQNATKIETLKKENKPTTKALQRKELLENMDPVPPHLLKYNNEIGKLRKELIPLLQLEEASRGRLLSVKETQTLTRKDEILEEIDNLEESSRGWFEEDNVFLSRVEASRERFASQHKSSKKKVGKGGGTVASVGADTKMKVSATKFYTPGDWSKTKSKKKKKVKGGGVFQAMMVDSSSDDDTEDDDEEEEEEELSLILGKSEEEKKPAPVVTNASSPGAASVKETTTGTSPTKKSKKKKKKNKSKSKQREILTTEEEDDLIAAATTVATPSKEEEKKKEGEKEEEEAEETTALSQTLTFLQTYVIPLIVAILKYMVAFLVWLIGLVFGTGKKKR